MKKLISILLIFALCASLLMITGCGSSSTEEATEEATDTATEEAADVDVEETATTEEEENEEETAEEELQEEETAEEVVEEASEEEEPTAEEETATVSYPLTEENITLTYMSLEHMEVTNFIEDGDWNNLELLAAAEEITGVTIDFIAISAPIMTERYSLSFASGDYCDMYYKGVSMYTTSADGAIEDEVFIRLNELIDEYAPNYKAAREADEDLMRETISDEGNIVSFYVISTEYIYDGMGYVTRKDLLDEAGLDIPVTYDDWYEMLTYYKTIGIKYPTYNIGDMGGLFFGGYGFDFNWIAEMNTPYYQIDGEVQFSPFSENFQLMIETLAQWYSEGLIYDGFYTMSTLTDVQALEISGDIGVWTAYANAMNIFTDGTTIEGAEDVAITNPVLNEGDTIHISTSTSLVGNDAAAISTTCEYPELAVQWIDFWYTDTGSMLYNYGVEGLTYEYDENGEPQLTELITNNPDGLSTEALQARYLGYCFPGLYDPTVLMGDYTEKQLTAMETWTSNVDDDWNYPAGATLTADESVEYNTYYSDISTYMAEHFVAMITGAEPLSNYDTVIQTLHDLGADECIALKQAALDRYYDKALN